MELTYADENMGRNIGKVTYINGVLLLTDMMLIKTKIQRGKYILTFGEVRAWKKTKMEIGNW